MPLCRRSLLIVQLVVGVAANTGALLAQRPGALAGVVRDSSGKPILGADVSVESLQRQSLSEADGRYRLADVTAGVRTVSVRRLGYAALLVPVQFLPDETVERNFVLTEVATALDTVKVSEQASHLLTGRSAFYERKLRGIGRHLDSTDLKRFPELKANELLQTEGGVQLVNAPPCRPYTERDYNCVVGLRHSVAVTRGACAMKVVLDNMVVGLGGQIDQIEPNRGNGNRRPNPRYAWFKTFDLSTVSVSSLEKVEIYRRSMEVPGEFQSDGAECGLVMLWTKQY